ncbi:MAG: phosphotransferase, partial [Anaerolineae bacterium]|nr:phosphotransferase [Anaerolineae bacterium]
MMLENVQSPLVEPVTESDLLMMLRATLDPEIEIVEQRQLTGGLFNTSYYLATRHPDHAIILRIAPAASKHNTLFDYEKTMMAAEPAIYDLMRGVGIPVPDVLAIDTAQRVIPRHYILLDYLKTTPMNDPAVPEA